MAALLPFRNNLARSEFIRVKFFGRGAVVPTAIGPSQAPPLPPPPPLGPKLPSDSAGSRESH